MWTREQEASKLKERFRAGVKNRAQFARDFGVPGGPIMIYHHINNVSPLSMDAALAYARGFRVSLAEISPRLAAEAVRASAALDPPNRDVEQITATEAEEPAEDDQPPGLFAVVGSRVMLPDSSEQYVLDAYRVADEPFKQAFLSLADIVVAARGNRSGDKAKKA